PVAFQKIAEFWSSLRVVVLPHPGKDLTPELRRAFLEAARKKRHQSFEIGLRDLPRTYIRRSDRARHVLTRNGPGFGEFTPARPCLQASGERSGSRRIGRTIDEFERAGAVQGVEAPAKIGRAHV